MRLAALFRHPPKVGRCLGTLALTFAITSTQAQSQFTPPPKTAVVTGTVTDQAGGSVPNATITLKAAEGFILETKTAGDGRFAIDAWPGEYTLKTSAQGFAILINPITLAAATNLTEHVVLLIVQGGCGVCVTIEPLIELENPGYPLTTTLPLKLLPPLKLHPRDLKKSPTVT
jgi:hypothetical protein